MASAEETEAPSRRTSLEFVEYSILDTIIPHSTKFDIEEALRGSVERLDNPESSPLSSILQRQFLFFGKTRTRLMLNVLLMHRSQMRKSMSISSSKLLIVTSELCGLISVDSPLLLKRKLLILL